VQAAILVSGFDIFEIFDYHQKQPASAAHIGLPIAAAQGYKLQKYDPRL